MKQWYRSRERDSGISINANRLKRKPDDHASSINSEERVSLTNSALDTETPTSEQDIRD